MRTFYLLLAIVCLTVNLLQSEDYKTVSTKDTISFIQSPRYITSDSDNNVWVNYIYRSSNNIDIPKIAKWDGTELKIYSEADGLPFGVVRNMVSSKSEGNIWLATADGLTLMNSEGLMTDYPLPQDTGGYRVIKESFQSQIVEDNSGRVYCLTEKYPDRNIYDNYPNRIVNTQELWILENGIWKDASQFNFSNTINASLYPSDEGVLVYFRSIDLGQEGSWVLNINGSEIKDTITPKAFSPNIKFDPSSMYLKDSKLYVGFKPQDLSITVNAFSTYDLQTKEWSVYGPKEYRVFDPTLDFHDIPTAVRVNGGIDFPERNNVRMISDANGEGVWLGMEIEHRADWLKEKGGGLLYFDGDKTFRRYASDTDDGQQRFWEFAGYDELGTSLAMTTQWSFMTGTAYDKQGNLFVSSAFGGLWVIPQSSLPEPTSIEEETISKGHQYMLSPNIIDRGSNLNINTSSHISNINSLEIVDINGNKVFYKSNLDVINTPLDISTENLASGLYFVLLRNNSGMHTEKLIIR